MKLEITKVDEETLQIKTVKVLGSVAGVSKLCVVIGGAVKIDLGITAEDMKKGQVVTLDV